MLERLPRVHTNVTPCVLRRDNAPQKDIHRDEEVLCESADYFCASEGSTGFAKSNKFLEEEEEEEGAERVTLRTTADGNDTSSARRLCGRRTSSLRERSWTGTRCSRRPMGA